MQIPIDSIIFLGRHSLMAGLITSNFHFLITRSFFLITKLWIYFFFTKKQELAVVCIMNTKIEEAEWQKNKLTFHIIVFMYYVHVTSSDHVIWRQFIPLLTCQRPLFKFLDCLLLLKNITLQVGQNLKSHFSPRRN